MKEGEEPYTNREISREFELIHKSLKSVHDEMSSGFTKVTSRQDVANGRTKTNELRIAMAMGGLAILGVTAVPLLSWALYTLVNIDSSVREVVTQELSHYEFEVAK
jgi:hypothetical protein